MAKRWMLYGANGYTGELTARLARERGLSPVLAGRNRAKIEALAGELGLEHAVFALDDEMALLSALRDVSAILLDAGPFSHTSKPVVEACLQTGTHYLDITGEIAVFERVFRRGEEAERKGVCLMPGVGFDVIPTDCTAVRLKEALPSATHLELAFHPRGGPSRGTTKTAIEGLGGPGAERVDGKIVPVPFAQRMRHIPYPKKARDAITIPWGDVSTAFYSTGIPNIRTYFTMPPSTMKNLRRLSSLGPLVGNRLVRGLLTKAVEKRMTGPDDAARAAGYSEVWGEVTDDEGNRVSSTLESPEGYSFTADASLRAMERVLENPVPGAHTAAMLWGWKFVEECDGVTVHPLQGAE